MSLTLCSALSGRILKVTHGDDTRRAKLEIPVDAGAKEVFLAIQTTSLTLFSLPPSTAENMTLKYLDEEGDLCTLTSGTIDDFAFSTPEGALRLTLTLKTPDVKIAGDGGAKETPAQQDSTGPYPAVSDSAQSNNQPDSATVEMRELLRSFVDGHIDANGCKFVSTMLRGMEPNTVYGYVQTALSRVDASSCQGFGTQDTKAALTKVASLLPNLDPVKLHSLMLDVLDAGAARGSGSGDAQNVPPNLFATLGHSGTTTKAHPEAMLFLMA